MTTPIHNEEERLSAAIDGLLSPREQQELDNELVNNPALRADKEALEATVALLRGLEPLAPPRSFTLDPAIHGAKPGLGWGWLRWASTLGALALVVVVSSVLWGLDGGANESASMVPEVSQALSADDNAVQPQGAPVGGAPPADGGMRMAEATPEMAPFMSEAAPALDDAAAGQVAEDALPEAELALPGAEDLESSVESGGTAEEPMETLIMPDAPALKDPAAETGMVPELSETETSSPDTVAPEAAPAPELPAAEAATSTEPGLEMIFLATLLLGLLAAAGWVVYLRRREA